MNDLDIGDDEEVAIENRQEFLDKIEKRVKTLEVKVLSESRPGKKLLVLDIDYTLFGMIFIDILLTKKYLYRCYCLVVA